MATQKIVWNDKLKSVWDKKFLSLDYNVHKTITQWEEYQKNIIRNDSSLTENEKKFLLNELQMVYDKAKIGDNSVEKQQCKNCQNWHQATQYCEFCIRKYLENNFRNWTSGNEEIDKLIRECQQKTVSPQFVVEWINYDQFENIEHLTEGGCATIYTAIWKVGCYDKWNSKNQILERFGREKVILKRLNNSNSNSIHWFQEVTLSFTLDNTFYSLAVCHGLTKDPSTNDYMLVLMRYDNDLRHFLKDNYQTLTLLQKYRIIYDLAYRLIQIHEKNIMHRDLHSGNILYNAPTLQWFISDLGLSGPADKPLNSIYGNLPYVAPEVYCGQIYTIKSDIYSIGILMWEVTLSFTLDNTFYSLAVCHGLTKDPSTNDYMLVLMRYDNDLRHFLKDNYQTLTLLQKYRIIYDLAYRLIQIHEKNIMHRDLHSGNILYNAPTLQWFISDLGLSGPADKPLNSIYGNLPYVAPEVYCGQIYTIKSDIYSIGILMWEVITSEIPYGDHEHDSDLAFAIASGYRPTIYENIPLEYATLMKQCWDANPDNRPDANIIYDKMKLLVKSLYEEMDKQQDPTIQSKNFKSKIKKFFKSSSTKNEDKQVIKNIQFNENKGSKIYKIQTSKVYTLKFSIQPRNATDADKPLNSIYGNLPYVAPEVYCGQIYTIKSDIYSIGILMWEVITSEIPYGDHEHDSDLAFAIASGYRPTIYENIPLEYATLMKQCWDANPDNRPDANIIYDKMKLLVKSLYEEMDKQQDPTIQSKNFKSKIKKFFKSSSTKNEDKQVIKNIQFNENKGSKIYKIQTSKVYTLKFSIQPRNATDEEQQAFDSGQFDFEISEEMEQLYLKSIVKSIGADNSNKSCADGECGIAGPSNLNSQFQD
ncbi:hypothetical protein Glove_103g12 [Diversispora epigaea]|uniref:Protein kinase domain-containing protein n=1 Tax=Diversispora epigaea TaxID=1348612 RepID=A0A397JCP8_9GLOM|nr:hypothetical protein Glove_103g12 [Diversispora epigaea]